jgi:ADP-ribosylglycohydrolase
LTLSRKDRITGCLLGGALGDAVGAHFEGSVASDTFSFPSDLRVTDTQLTIATCESIVESRAVSPESVADHFTRWFRDRRITGIGSSTLKAFTELEAGGHWALVGVTGESSAGNGVQCGWRLWRSFSIRTLTLNAKRSVTFVGSLTEMTKRT